MERRKKTWRVGWKWKRRATFLYFRMPWQFLINTEKLFLSSFLTHANFLREISSRRQIFTVKMWKSKSVKATDESILQHSTPHHNSACSNRSFKKRNFWLGLMNALIDFILISLVILRKACQQNTVREWKENEKSFPQFCVSLFSLLS